MSQNYSKTAQICHFDRITVNFNAHIYNGQSLCQHKRAAQLPTYQYFTHYACVLWGAGIMRLLLIIRALGVGHSVREQ